MKFRHYLLLTATIFFGMTVVTLSIIGFLNNSNAVSPYHKMALLVCAILLTASSIALAINSTEEYDEISKELHQTEKDVAHYRALVDHFYTDSDQNTRTVLKTIERVYGCTHGGEENEREG